MFYSPKSHSKLVKRLKKTDILVFRTSSTGIKFSKPCCECIKTLKSFNIRGVYYSLDNGKLVYEKLCDIQNNHKSQMTRHIDRNF
jgi:hypothetical protein